MILDHNRLSFLSMDNHLTPNIACPAFAKLYSNISAARTPLVSFAAPSSRASGYRGALWAVYINGRSTEGELDRHFRRDPDAPAATRVIEWGECA